MVSELSEKSWAHVHASRDRLLSEVLEQPIDEARVERAIGQVYGFVLDLAPPRFIWVDSPGAVLKVGAAEYAPNRDRQKVIEELRSSAVAWGSPLSWLHHWLTIDELDEIESVDAETRAHAEAFRDALMCLYWLAFDELAVLSRHHVELHRDDRMRLHRTDGPAWLWADGYAIYALDGIRLPDWAVVDPDPQRIMAELTNAEQRRVALTYYGWDRAVADLELRILDHHPDPEIGTLYALPSTLLAPDWSATLLVCRNSSPSLDGTYRTYALLADGAALTVAAARESLNRDGGLIGSAS